MPTYEMPVLFKLMSKADVRSALKRTAETLFSTGGIIRKIENLGQKPMPYKTSAHGTVHREANYFIFYFDAPPTVIADLNEEYGRDVDIVRRRIYKQDDDPPQLCTLSRELKPAPYRPEVQSMLAIANKLKKPKFKYNSGMDFYPFQK